MWIGGRRIMSALRRPVARTVALLVPILCVMALLAPGSVPWNPPIDAVSLLLPALAVTCSIWAERLRIVSGPWRLAAPFLAGTFVLLGPLWTIAAALVGRAIGWWVRGGRVAWAAESYDLGAFGIGIILSLAMYKIGVTSSAALALVLVLVWRGSHLLATGKMIGAIPALFVPAGIAMAIGGLIESGMTVWTLIALLPTALIAGVAREQIVADARVHQTLQALALMLQRAHPYTHAHIERVARIAERTALHLGLDPERAKMVHEAARLHDVGKIAVDEQILDKPGKLTADEYAHVKLHAPFGAAILEEIEELRSISEWIRFHHERPDGKGYPKGLSGDEIPLEAKIIAVADAFDAMTGGFEGGGEKRPYRDPISPELALVEMERCAGTQFDSKVVTAFREALMEESRP